MFYAHAQKQTNKHNSLSLSLSCCLATFGPPPLLFGQSHSPASIQKEQLLLLLCLLLLSLSLFISHLRQHNSLNTAFLIHITTLPPSSACLSWDAQTLWPPRRWSFERVSSWWWGQFRPWRRSSSGGSRRSSCPCPPALEAGWPSCRWCGPRGQSSSPLLRRAARRPPDHVRYLEHWEKWHRVIRKVKLKSSNMFTWCKVSNVLLSYSTAVFKKEMI